MTASMLSVVAKCSKCQADVTLKEVTRVADLDGRFVVLFFTCQGCRVGDKVAVARPLYESLRGEFMAGRQRIDDVVAVMHFDLEDIEGVDDFMLYCGSLGAPLESNVKCRCPRCSGGV